MDITKSHLRIFIGLGAIFLVTLACNLPTLPGGSSGTACTGETFVVTVTLDLNDGACDENCSLREAILAANACAGPDHIHLGSSVYNLTATGPGDERGDLNIHDDLTITGEGQDATIIESSTFRVFAIDEDVTVSMQDLTIRGGMATENGGGILNAGDLTLMSVSLRENSASGDGGGVYSSGSLNLSNVIIDRNSASRGGGILNTGNATLSEVQVTMNVARVAFPASEEFDVNPELGSFNDCGGGINNQGSMSISGSQISYNLANLGGGICNGTGASMEISSSEITWNPYHQAEGLGYTGRIRGGGGIVNYYNLTISDSNISNNQANSGGGLYGLMLEGGNLQVERSDIQSNRALTGNGGGLYMLAGDLTILQSLIADNAAGNSGAGLYMNKNFEYSVNRMNVSISHSAIIRNEAQRDGGGVYHGGGNSSSPSVLELLNTTISGNLALEDGGGVFEASGSSGETHFWHVTIADNTARTRGDGAGGIYHHVLSGTTYFKSTLIATNWFWDCGIDSGGSGRPNIVDEGYNLEVGSFLCGFASGSDNGADGLTALTEVGGTFVHELLPFSPAVDRVPLEACAADDQRGVTRPSPEGGWCDTGAYELELFMTSGEIPQEELATATVTPTPEDQPQEPGANTDTLCWEGPGDPYKVVSAISNGTILELLGRGENGGWLVVNNPRYNVPCWLPEEHITVDPIFDLSTLEIIPVPFLPTPTPTPTSTPEPKPTSETITGCLYKGPNDNQASCYPIDQCPVSFNQSQGACSP